MKPYLGYGVGENNSGSFTVAVFFIQAGDVEGALRVLKEEARKQWPFPAIESLTLLPPGRIPAEWIGLFTGLERHDELIDHVVQAATILTEMVA